MTYEAIAIFSLLSIALTGATWKLSQAMSKNTLTICNKIDAVDLRLTVKIDAVDLKLTKRIDALSVDVQKLDKRLHGIEVLYLNKVFPKPADMDNLEDNAIDLEEG